MTTELKQYHTSVGSTRQIINLVVAPFKRFFEKYLNQPVLYHLKYVGLPLSTKSCCIII